ncbi:hypothetical protein [Paenibacillus prosopidis]|uniref:Class I SAM-dependent methyltransferase n=1 Tax=Paenibacillus prosopidis TaxID=630520 RepID=A0A368W563_9BACL|nr:hypothetical protein [Paenibacillus prosopidis]RCW50895.1 hypothetical protein DFP97_10287 [Paenibacillus prosopidis]
MSELEWIKWEMQGKPVPPPDVVKQFTVRSYGKQYSLPTLIETGTFLGDMISAVKDSFQSIISVELEPSLYELVRKKFSTEPHISIVFGDSGEVLPGILANIKHPCLFWLDGHWSGGYVKTARGALETPIRQELHHIFQHPVKEHVILIDDARMFTGQNDYPTLDELRALVRSYDASLQFHLEHDIIRIHR